MDYWGTAQPNWATLKTGDVVNGYRFTGTDPSQRKDRANWQPLSGQDLLDSMAPGDAAVVKAMVDGRKSWPKGFATKLPYWLIKIQQAGMYDPNFDETTYDARKAMRVDMAKNAPNSAGGNIRAANTVIGHIGQLAAMIPDVADHDIQALNWAQNLGAEAMGQPGPTNWDKQAAFVASELPKVLRGGMTSESDVNRFISLLSKNQSQAQKVQGIQSILAAIDSRMNEMKDAWDSTMGPRTSGQPHLLTPQSMRILNAFNAYAQSGKMNKKALVPDDPTNPGGLTNVWNSQFLDDTSQPSPNASQPSSSPAGPATGQTPLPLGMQGIAPAAPKGAANIQVPADAIQFLKQHPELAPAFDQKYGQGASRAALGAQ